MESKDIFNISLTIAILLMAGCALYVSFYLVKALKSVTRLVDNLEDTAEDIKLLRNQFKVKALTTLIAVTTGLLSRFLKKRG